MRTGRHVWVAIAAVVGLAHPLRAADYEKEIAAFEAADRLSPPPKNAVVFVGASGIRRWTTMERDLPGVTLIRRGFGGSRIKNATACAGRIITPCAPRLVVLQAGNNDIHAGATPEEVLKDFRAFVAAVRKGQPEVPIAFISITTGPARHDEADKVRAANKLIRAEVEAGTNLTYIDIYPAMLDAAGKPRKELFVEDGIHMNEQGYKVRAKIILPYVADNPPEKKP